MSEAQLPPHWKAEQLGQYIFLQTGKRMKGGGLNEGEVLSIGGEHICGDGNLILDKPKYINEEFYNNLSQGKIQRHDVLLVKDGATTGKLAFISKLYEDKMAINEHVFILRSQDSAILLNDFLFFFLFSDNGQQQIRKNFHGLIGGIKRSDVHSILIHFPPLLEQRSIARALRAVQEARETRRREAALERERKAAFMDYLFTHGTHNEPRQQTEIGEIPQSSKK